MEAAVLIGIFLVLVGLIWGGITIRNYISSIYNYNIFSFPNLFFGSIALMSIAGSILIAADAEANITNLKVLLGFSGIIFLTMYFVNLSKTNWWLALFSVFYQIATSTLIVFIILWIWIKYRWQRIGNWW